MSSAPGRFWIIRYPSSSGDVIAKFDTAGKTTIPDKVYDYSNFAVTEVSDQSSLKNKTIDHSGLSTDEMDLLSEVYPVTY